MIRSASLFLVVVALCIAVRSDEDAPRVKTSLGNIKGYLKISKHGKLYEAYEGVPYALPPIGELRFKVRITLCTPIVPYESYEVELFSINFYIISDKFN